MAGAAAGTSRPAPVWEEEKMEFYRRMNTSLITIYRGPRKAADNPAPSEPPQQEEK